MDFKDMRGDGYGDQSKWEVPEEDVLSDSVYLYDWKKKEIQRVE